MVWKGAIVEEKADSSVRLQQRIRDIEGRRESAPGAVVLIAVEKDRGRLSGSRDLVELGYKLATGSG